LLLGSNVNDFAKVRRFFPRKRGGFLEPRLSDAKSKNFETEKIIDLLSVVNGRSVSDELPDPTVFV